MTHRPESPLCFYEQTSLENYHNNDSLYNTGLLTVDNSEYATNYSNNYSTSPCQLMDNLSLESPSTISQFDNSLSYSSESSFASYYNNNHPQNDYRSLSPRSFDFQSDDSDLTDGLIMDNPALAELTEEDLFLLDTANRGQLEPLTPDWDLLGASENMSTMHGASASSSETMRMKRTIGRQQYLSPTPEFLHNCGKAIGITGVYPYTK